MDKSDIAIFIAVLSAAFSAWQGYSGHVVARINRQASRRKEPAFEISSGPSSDYPGWVRVEVIARNFEPVTVKVTELKCAKKHILLLPYDAQFEAQPDYNKPQRKELPIEEARQVLTMNRRIGAAGEQAYVGAAHHIPRPTEYLLLFAQAGFEARNLNIGWTWADGQKR